MHARTPHQSASTRISSSHEGQPVVCIVDPQTADYEPWRALAATAGVRLEFLTQASEALRMARSQPVALWVINTALSDLGGSDLCAMLKSRGRQSAVFLVTDEYSLEQERAACAARATLFGCKPAHREWLAEWLAHRASGTPATSIPALAHASCD